MLKKLLYLLTITCLILTLACDALGSKMKTDQIKGTIIVTFPATVTFNISIRPDINIGYSHFCFSSNPELANVDYIVNNFTEDDPVNGIIDIGEYKWTNDFNHNEGFYIQLAGGSTIQLPDGATEGDFYIRRNPEGTPFITGDALDWTFTISGLNLDGDFEINYVSSENATVTYTVE